LQIFPIALLGNRKNCKQSISNCISQSSETAKMKIINYELFKQQQRTGR